MEELNTYHSFDPSLSVSEQIRLANTDLRHNAIITQPAAFVTRNNASTLPRNETSSRSHHVNDTQRHAGDTYVSFDHMNLSQTPAASAASNDVIGAIDSAHRKRQQFSFNKDSNSGDTWTAGYSSDDDAAMRAFAHHDVTTTHGYDQHSQDWIIPRRIMCAFFWIGIILLFTGIVLLVTSKHQVSGAYTSWGAVLLGLGFCLLLICFILCMHAYCVISDDNDDHLAPVAPPMRPVPPPSPSVFAKPAWNTSTIHSQPHDSAATRTAVHYSTMNYNTNELGNKSRLDSSDSALNCATLPPQNCATLTLEQDTFDKKLAQFDSPRQLKKKTNLTDDNGLRTGATSDLQPDTPVPCLQAKHRLEVVGKLPSYSTACQMTQYSPQPEFASQFSFSNGRGGAANEALDKSTLMRRVRLQKTTSFDDGSDQAGLATQSADIYQDNDNIDGVFSRKAGAVLNIATETSWSDKTSTTQRAPHVVNASTANRRDVIPGPASTEERLTSFDVELSRVNNVAINDRCSTDVVTSAARHDVAQSCDNNPVNVCRNTSGDDVTRCDSPAQSVYDNVAYKWQPKSGSELKHFHF